MPTRPCMPRSRVATRAEHCLPVPPLRERRLISGSRLAHPHCASSSLSGRVGGHLLKGLPVKRIVVGTAGALLMVGLVAAPAAADERACRGSIGATTLDNVRVPSGATCTLTGTTVKGTVKVERGATLKATRVRVVGNVQGEGHRLVNVASSTVGGSIQLVQGGGAALNGNKVTGDVQSFTNRASQTILRNRIDGNLQCKENRPAPRGTANVVGGNKEDQCRRL